MQGQSVIVRVVDVVTVYVFLLWTTSVALGQTVVNWLTTSV